MYHSWTFRNTGEVHTIRAEDGFTGGLQREDFNLQEVPRIESYREFVFICFDPDAPNLVTYLGNVARYIDFLADQGNDGMEIVEGTQLYAARANWKLQMENVIDFYHTVPLHTSYFRFLESTGADISGGVGGAGYDLGNGHSAVHFKAPWGRPVARWEPRWGEAEKLRLEALRSDIETRVGHERAEMICDWDCNFLVFPNLTVADVVALVVRVVNPISADMMEITQWCLAPKGEPEEARMRRLHAFNTFLGPGGFATPDDIEVFEGSQRAFGAHRELTWSDFSRGYYAEETRPKAEVQSDHEGQHRAFYREWARRINGRISAQMNLASPREDAAE
jgi:phenylpropionate dioxygenase-like ring-hydroxylating dioxygenase large terminal subunit